MLKQRIEILKTSGVIDEDVALFVNDIIDEFSSKNFNEGKMETFTTHLAMSTERIKKNEPVEDLDDVIWMDVKNNENFEQFKIKISCTNSKFRKKVYINAYLQFITRLGGMSYVENCSRWPNK